MSNQEAIEKHVEGEPQLGYFIDPYSDWGFKHLFGKEPNRKALISFLNVVFKGRKTVIDIKYADKEYKGPAKTTARQYLIYIALVMMAKNSLLKSRKLHPHLDGRRDLMSDSRDLSCRRDDEKSNSGTGYWRNGRLGL